MVARTTALFLALALLILLPPRATAQTVLPLPPGKLGKPTGGSSEPGGTTTGGWTKIVNPPPHALGAILLLTDGTVLAHNEDNDFTAWYRLTPDKNGSYVNGTWSAVGSLPATYAPLYFGSVVLPDGKVVIEGGEYNCPAGVTCAPSWQNQGAMYDPAANSWTPILPPTGWANIGDAQAIVLADGTYMQADCCGKALQQNSTPLAAYFNEASQSWTQLDESSKFDEFDEEGWTLLPNGKVLTVDAYVGSYDAGGMNSELWDPGARRWSSAGNTVVQLWDSAAACSASPSQELGPAILRPGGTVFYAGSNSCGAAHTAIYNSATGMWSAGPDFPNGNAINDGPGALELNGNVIVFASPGIGTFTTPGQFYEWNGSTLTAISNPPNAVNDNSFFGHLLNLPNGQVMFTDFSTDVEFYTPAGTFQDAWRPKVTSVPATLFTGSTYQISGTQFNGLSQASAYGDDFQNATNYPLVRLVNKSTGHVFYLKTHGHSSMGVATGTKIVTTNFDVPAGIETGAAKLYVVANGIPSPPVSVSVY
jgi:hypothetical protein